VNRVIVVLALALLLMLVVNIFLVANQNANDGQTIRCLKTLEDLSNADTGLKAADNRLKKADDELKAENARMLELLQQINSKEFAK